LILLSQSPSDPRDSLATTNTALEAADKEVVGLHDRLEQANLFRELVLLPCKENEPWAIWLNRFWCLMINITYELMCLLVFMFVVHKMLKLLELRH
jgi:hypothetical protein